MCNSDSIALELHSTETLYAIFTIKKIKSILTIMFSLFCIRFVCFGELAEFN